MNRTATANGPAAQAPAVETQAEPGLLDRVVEATAYHRQFSLDEVKYMAENTAKSKMYGLDSAQAFVILMLAESEGLHPMQAVRRYHIIEGKPSMRADAMQAEFQRHGGRLRWITSTAEECRAEFWHPTFHPEHLSVCVTMRELLESEVALQWPKRKDGDPPAKAKVLKMTYRQFPRQMLRARVISEGVRAIDPGVVVGIYTPEEVSDFDDRPSPRPLPADAPASRVEPVAATAEPPASTGGGYAAGGPAPQSEPSEAKQWIQARIDEANNEWAMTCGEAKKDYKPLCSLWQLLNGLITKYLEDGLLAPEQVQGENSKRSNRKMGAAIATMWADDADQTKDDVDMYLRLKQEAAAHEVGINLDSEPKEESLSNG
jgi:hypothetical protein